MREDRFHQISPGGCTALHPGWVAGGLEVSEHFDASRLNRVIVVSDGMTNVGESNPRVIIDQAGQLFERGVSTTTIGIGDAFSEDLLIPMAIGGGGNAWYIETEEEYERVFARELSGIRTLYAERSTLTLEPRGAEIVDVLNNFPWTTEGALRLPPLQGDSPLSIVVRLAIDGHATGTDAFPLTVRFEGKTFAKGTNVGASERLMIHSVSPEFAASTGPNPAVTRRAARLELARIMEKCVRRIDAGDLDGAHDLLNDAIVRAREMIGDIGTEMLASDLKRLYRIQERLLDRAAISRNRKAFKFTALNAQRDRYPGKTSRTLPGYDELKG